MKLYHYARDGRYIGTSKAEKDPQDKSEWIVPAGATTDPTPGKAKAGMQWYWGGSSWQMRGDGDSESTTPAEPAPSGKQRYWKPSGQAMEVSVNAKLPDDAILEPPPAINSPQVVRHQDGKWVVLADYRGFVYFDEEGNKVAIKELGVEPPRNAVKTPPPEVGENEARVFRDGEWVVVPDYTGQVFWGPDGLELPPMEFGKSPPEGATHEPPALGDIKTWASEQVTKNYVEFMKEIVDIYPRIERESFMSQEAEAKAYLTAKVDQTPVPETPTLSAILVGRNGAGGKETLEELSRKVLGHAEAFHSAQFHTGRRQRLIKQIQAATTADVVRAVK